MIWSDRRMSSVGDADVAASFLRVPDVLSAVLDGPTGRALEADRGLAERRLPATGLADEGDDVVLVDVERDAVDGADGVRVREEVEEALVLLEVDLTSRARRPVRRRN